MSDTRYEIRNTINDQLKAIVKAPHRNPKYLELVTIDISSNTQLSLWLMFLTVVLQFLRIKISSINYLNLIIFCD